MEFVEGDDEPVFRRPPDPDDRIWRHPSEMVARPAARRRERAARSIWMAAIASAVGASALTAGVVLGAGGFDRGRSPATVAASTSVPARTASAVTADTSVEPVAAVAERARPSIVQLQVRRESDGTIGSGVLFRADGHVLTNAHVVSGAVSVTVVLSNGRSLPAQLVGADQESDIAVVKAEGAPFPAAELAAPGALRVGQQAIAMGSPVALGGGPSVTAGVVSALHRTVRTESGQTLYGMIQTDAPISPGSSGGALLDLHGRVIGITTALSGAGDGPGERGFATPAEVAQAIAEQLMESGHTKPVWLGIEGHDLDGATAHSLGVQGGALVNLVRHDSPASRAGLAARDVIVAVDGRTVTSMGMLVVALRMLEPGDDVTLEVRRDGETHTLKAVLAERPPAAQ